MDGAFEFRGGIGRVGVWGAMTKVTVKMFALGRLVR
jgi:hypothetical protein